MNKNYKNQLIIDILETIAIANGVGDPVEIAILLTGSKVVKFWSNNCNVKTEMKDIVTIEIISDKIVHNIPIDSIICTSQKFS